MSEEQNLLFKIGLADKFIFSWKRSKKGEPSYINSLANGPDGTCKVTLRTLINVDDVSIYKKDLLPEVSSDPNLHMGPRLFEQTDYQIFLKSLDGSPVNIQHRDPNVISDLTREENSKIIHGYVNFGSQIGNSIFTVFWKGEPQLDVEIQIFPTKLDYATDFQSLMAEIQEIMTSLAMEYLQSTYHLGKYNPEDEPSNLEWLTLLKGILKELEKALTHITNFPITDLNIKSKLTPIGKIRKVDNKVRSAVRSCKGAGRLVDIGNDVCARQRVWETKAEPTLDTPEHRWLASQLDAIQMRLARLIQKEKRIAENSVYDLSARKSETIQELKRFKDTILSLRKRSPLNYVNGSPNHGFASLKLLCAPGYREAYTCLMILRLGLRIEGGPLKLSIKDLSELYEYWCFIALLKLVANSTGQSIPSDRLFKIHQSGLKVLLEKGKSKSIVFKDKEDKKITVSYNPQFKGEAYLTSQKPDIMLSFENPSWPQLDLVLDAKYRLDNSDRYISQYGCSGPPEDALNVLYRYRDALLNTGSSKDYKHSVVQAAAVYPYEEDDNYKISHLKKSLLGIGVGAVPMLPGKIENLKEWLDKALKQGGWELAEKTIPHSAMEQIRDWRVKASKAVLVGILGHGKKELEWMYKEKKYYKPLSKTQQRTLNSQAIAIFLPNTMREGRGAIEFYFPVLSTQVMYRKDIKTPWQSSHIDPDELCVVYQLGDKKSLEKPILNEDGERVSVHRWSSLLALEKSSNLKELMIETEPGWQLYEGLKARRVSFKLRSDKVELQVVENPAEHVCFVLENGEIIRYRGTSGFLLKYRTGEEKYFSTGKDVLHEVDRIYLKKKME